MFCIKILKERREKKTLKSCYHSFSRQPTHTHPFTSAKSGIGKWNDIKISTLLWLAAKTKLNFFSVEKDFNKLSKSTRQFIKWLGETCFMYILNYRVNVPRPELKIDTKHFRECGETKEGYFLCRLTCECSVTSISSS